MKNLLVQLLRGERWENEKLACLAAELREVGE